MYKESSVGIKDVLVQTTSSGYKYVGQIGRSGRLEEKMEHLVCSFIIYLIIFVIGVIIIMNIIT